MTTINLYQNPQKEQKNFSAISGGSGLFFSIGILTLTILALIGVKFAGSFLTKQNEALAATVQKEKESMAGLNNLEQVMDMQTRINQIKSNLQIKDGQVSRIQMTKALDYVGAEMNAGIVLSAYDYTDADKKIDLTFEANNFSDVAKQILNFKSSNYFTNVNLVKISRTEKTISCDMEMNIK